MLAWGSKVSPAFRERLQSIAQELGLDASWLMAVMAFESGGTFNPSIKNAAGSGAVGLIQFMPQTAQLLGTTTEDLAKMTAEEQLEVVRLYFFPSSHLIHNLPDLYMAVLWPGAIGKPMDYVLFKRDDIEHPRRYLQNKVLDWNHDGVVTKLEAAERVLKKLIEGLRTEHASL